MSKLRLFLVFIFFNSISFIVFSQDKLVFTIDIVRHADRTPLAAMPKSSYKWKEGYGELTSIGMHQENQKGRLARNFYVNQHHLLPEHYVAETMYVQSTALNRTLMSAESFLLGFYPLGTGPLLPNSQQSALPSGYQPIPIFTTQPHQDTLLRPDINHERYKTLLREYVYSTAAWHAKDTKLSSKYQKWSQASGIRVTKLADLNPLSDALFVYQQHQLPIPSGLSQSDVHEIIQNGHWAWSAGYKNPVVSTLGGIELLQKIGTELEEASKKKKPLKYILFLAHDSTIAAQMSILGHALSDIPPYASILNFSLFDKGYQQYSVRVTLNNQPVNIKFCGEGDCNLKQFLKFVEEKKSLADQFMKQIEPLLNKKE